MKVLTFSLAILFSLPYLNANCQTYNWANSLGGTYIERGISVTHDNNGSVYTTGVFTSTTDFDPGPGIVLKTPQNVVDIYIEKFDADGNFKWVKNIGSTDEVLAKQIEIDTDGNLVLYGSFSGTVDFDPGAGFSNLTSAGYNDIFILKLDKDGLFLWVKAIAGDGNEQAVKLVVDSENNIYAAGTFNGTCDIDPGPNTLPITSSSNFTSASFYLKLDGEGNTVWTHPLQANNNCGLSEMALNPKNNNIYLFGSFSDSLDFDPGVNEFYLYSASGLNFALQFRTDGSTVTAFNFWDQNFFNLSALTCDKYGNLALTGTLRKTADFDWGPGVKNLTAAGGGDAFVLVVDENFNYKWAISVGNDLTMSPISISTDNNGSVYSTGIFYGPVDFDPRPGKAINLNSGTSLGNSYIWKINSSGIAQWAKKVLTTGTSARIQHLSNKDRTIYGTGRFNGTADLDPGSGTALFTSTSTEDDIFNFQWTDSCANATQSNLTITACSKYISPSGLYTYNQSGVYKDTIGNSIGCDSIITIDLTVVDRYDTALTVATCGGYTVPSGDTTYYLSGTYYDTLTTVSGCDSSFIINLTVDDYIYQSFTVSACEQYTVPSGNQTYFGSGIFQDTLIGANSCDTVLTIDLTIKNNSYVTLDTTTCSEYLSPAGNIYYNSGTYQDTLAAANGCDSIIVIFLTRTFQVGMDVNLNTGIFAAYPNNAEYTWINCTTGNIIPGENSQNFTPQTNGNYAVIVTLDGCTDTAGCRTINNVSVAELSLTNVLLYPNPSTGIFYLKDFTEKITEIYLIDALGRTNMVTNSFDADLNTLNLTSYLPGVYYLKIGTHTGSISRQIVIWR